MRFTAGVDTVSGAQCQIEIDEAFLEAQAPIVDAMLEFTGRSSAFAYTTQHKPLRLPFTIEMWMIRPPLLRSNRGLLLALIDSSAADSLAAFDGPFLLYETGFPKLGMQYRFQGKSEAQTVMAGGHDDAGRYTVPSGEWVHFAVTVEPSPSTLGKCLHRFMINGETGPLRGVGSRDGHGEVLDYPGVNSNFIGDKPNHCDRSAALQGWGNPAFKLRVGSKFLGAINELRVWSRALTPSDVRRSMLVHDMAATRSALLHAWSFAGVMRDAMDQPTQVPDQAGGAVLTMNDGVHLGLIEAIEHNWRFCPGVSYQFPESVCGSEPTHAHGKCRKPRGVRRDERDNEGARERERGYECDCYEGYRSGINGDCTLECPGGYANPCSGHGRCIGTVAPIEPWENADGSVNDSYVGSDPNVHDRRQGAEVACVCDEGYVGPACSIVCPGWEEPWNRPQRLCSGYGTCNFTESGGATCQCFDGSQRYGDACEFAYGSEPDKVVSDCGACDGLNEECVDGSCQCQQNFYRVFGQCRSHSGDFAYSDNTTATFAAAFVVLAIFCICMAALVILYIVKFRV